MNFLNLVKHKTATFIIDDNSHAVLLTEGILEAIFNDTKPKEDDIIIYNDVHYQVKNYSHHRNLYVLWIQEV